MVGPHGYRVALFRISVVMLDPGSVRAFGLLNASPFLILNASLAYALKKIRVRVIGVEDSKSDEYLSMNPSGNVPSLRIKLPSGELDLSQSMAIMEYIEEKWPERGFGRLLPVDLAERAAVRAVSQ